MNKICYIIGAGEYFGSPSPSEGDLVICADGGYSSAISHGVRCDLLIGDLDSLGEAPLGVELLRHPVEKDDTDSRLAYLEGVRRGYSSFALYGCTGGSPDHTLANLALLSEAAQNGHTALMYGEGCVMECLRNGTRVYKAHGSGRFSVFAYGGEAQGVSIEGLKYEARDVTLSPHFPLGVSNSYIGKEARVSVKEGTLLIYREI